MGNRVIRESISAALVLSSVTAAAAEAGWATYQGNPAHTGFVDASITRNQPSLLWKTTVSSHPLVGLAVGGGTVFVSNTDNFTGLDSFHALDQQTGNILWSKAYSNNDTVSAPAYANGVVYFQTDGHSSGSGNFLHAYSARTGASVFDAPYSAQWETYLNPTPYNGNVYVGGGYYGGIYSFSASTNHQNWFGYVGQYDGWTPTLDSNYCYVFTGSGDTVPITGEFRMIDRTTGTTKYLVRDNGFQWNGYTMNSAVVLGNQDDAFVINDAGTIYPTGGGGGRLLSFELGQDPPTSPGRSPTASSDNRRWQTASYTPTTVDALWRLTS